MSFATVRAKVKKLLLEVEGIGQVHDYRRHATFWEKFIRESVKDGRVHAWEITRRTKAIAIAAVGEAVANEPLFHDDHGVVLVGYMSLNDEEASERDFQDIVDLITDKLSKNSRLEDTLIIPTFPQTPLIEHRMLGSTLVHYAEIVLQAQERVGRHE